MAKLEAMAAVPMMMHSMSMIMGGVFNRWPNLEVLLVGGGAAWLPTFLWRCDYQYQLMPGVEAPWMQSPPSSYFVKYFKVATYGLESPADVTALQAFLKVVPNIDRMLMYASCYPNADSEAPEAIAARIPAEWHRSVFHDNAMAFYGWPDATPAFHRGQHSVDRSPGARRVSSTSNRCQPGRSQMSTYRGPIVDSVLHFGPKSTSELYPYLPERWRDYFEGGGQAFADSSTTGAMWGAITPNSAQMRDSYPEDRSFPPGSDYEFTRTHVFDRHNHWRIILSALNSSELLNPWAGVPRRGRSTPGSTTRGLPSATTGCTRRPDAAVRSDRGRRGGRRYGDNPRFIAIQNTGGVHGLPCGNPVYDPIYDAACEYRMPLHLHPNGSGHYRMPTGPINTATAGVPMSLTGFAIDHITSLIVHGTFEKFPTLRVGVIEHGVLFLAHLMWRLDRNYALLKAESPWVKKLPSEYIREHIWIGSHPLEQGFDKDGRDVQEAL